MTLTAATTAQLQTLAGNGDALAAAFLASSTVRTERVGNECVDHFELSYGRLDPALCTCGCPRCAARGARPWA